MEISDKKIQFIQPDDWHLHVRDGQALDYVLKDTAKQFARAIIMPNLQPPVTRLNHAKAYYERINEALIKHHLDASFQPLMTLYLTDLTTPDEIKEAVNSGLVYAVKLYPAGATTNSEAGVTDLLKNCSKTLACMQELGLPLLVHGEVTSPEVDVFDREAIFIDEVMRPLRKNYPELKVVFEHITTKDGADYVTTAEGLTAATITPQHLLYNRNAIFNNGIRPHYYCLPILKREQHRQALLDAATSKNPRFFLGTDSAPHAQSAKENDCGCAGCYSALHALELYAYAFEQAGRLDALEAFASLHGPDFYGLTRNTRKVELVRQDYQIPQSVPYFDNGHLVPLAAGETLPWRFNGFIED